MERCAVVGFAGLDDTRALLWHDASTLFACGVDVDAAIASIRTAYTSDGNVSGRWIRVTSVDRAVVRFIVLSFNRYIQ